ncbi:uncharacterized protein BXIN_0857 [Babesia sp. Xinjiang]|uniref:uncharacterized protein n=1 Tax=Babesia sp. Xinjiang TaxID=462227 RepID=UPI000A234334|nr:uncharacterized protein BXIN_0857 [Babesia sp. Xinjiang]ORM41275.1 hypothetical protein BXIN_0857 [Babesia sp. Xinjiang]
MKENGFTRRDAILFLETVGIDTNDQLVDRFVAAGAGESREHRMVSGCSLQEFAELIEALKTNIRESKNEFRLNNPILCRNTNKLSKELCKYVREDLKAAEVHDLQSEIQRLYRFREKLENVAATRSLSEAEVRRLNDINKEIDLLHDELSKERHVVNTLSLM